VSDSNNTCIITSAIIISINNIDIIALAALGEISAKKEELLDHSDGINFLYNFVKINYIPPSTIFNDAPRLFNQIIFKLLKIL